MMDPLGVAGDLGADDASGIGLRLGSMDAPNRLAVDDLHVQRANGRAVVRAGGRATQGSGRRVHGAA